MFERKCIECGASLLQDSLFCHFCGAKRTTCSCGAFIDAGMIYCAKCGKKVPSEILLQTGSRKYAREMSISKHHDYVELTHPKTFCMVEIFHGKFMTWFDAVKYAKNLRIGGFDDWRLPTVEEFEDGHLSMFIYPKEEEPDFSCYWTSDTLSVDAPDAMSVMAFTKQPVKASKQSLNCVICVR